MSETMTCYAIDDDPGHRSAVGSQTRDKEVTLVGLTEVSDRVHGQKMLARLPGEIAHAARLSILGELAASIAHEISQPLTAIGSNTEALQLWLGSSSPNLDEVRELTARTAAEVQRAADIIHRIRAMVMHSATEQTCMAVNPVIEDAMLFLRHELERNRVGVSLHLEDHLPEILGDRVQLHQVLVNLAVNAIQAMNDTETTARRLLISSSLQTDNWVNISVEDTGPGVAPDSHDRVFERFFTTRTAGMGIGLPICRTIIAAHRGRIDLDNRSNCCGAHFRIVLPACLSRFPS
jgi:C4-dicarboxylate-specific signal transduction histidine kinase